MAKSKRNNSMRILLLLTLVITISIGIYWWQTSHKQKAKPPANMEVSTPTIVKPSTLINATIPTNTWQTFNSKGEFVFTHDSETNFSFSEDKSSFTLQYPGNWTLDVSVFHDETGQKVGEFSPGLVLVEPGYKCFPAPFESYQGRLELISETNIQTPNGLTGVLRVTKNFPEGILSHWYPHEYCMIKENKATYITFYSRQLTTEQAALYNTIVSTLTF